DTADPRIPEYRHAGSQRGRHRPDGSDHERRGAAGRWAASEGAVVVRSEPAPSLGILLWRAVVRLSRRALVWRAAGRYTFRVVGPAAAALAFDLGRRALRRRPGLERQHDQWNAAG